MQKAIVDFVTSFKCSRQAASFRSRSEFAARWRRRKW